VKLDKEHWHKRVSEVWKKSCECKFTILWKQGVPTNRTCLENKPNITIRDHEKGTCVLTFKNRASGM